MSENYYGFQKFCNLLNDSNVLKKHSVMGVVKMLQLCIVEIKSDVLKDLMELEISKSDYYLDLKILEIEKQDYLKDYGIDRISHILENLNVTIDALKDLDYPPELSNIIDKNLSPDEYHENFDSIRATQTNLLLFFLNYYANELISFLESKKIKQTPEASVIDSIEKLSKSEIIVNNFGKAHDTLKELNKKMYAEIQLEHGNDPWDHHTTIESKYDVDIDELEHDLKGFLEELYYASFEDGYFYFDCSCKVYQQNYNERKQAYLNKIIDSTEEDFIYSEIKYLTSPYNNRILYVDGWLPESYHAYIEYNDQYRIPLSKKLSFLDLRLIPYNKTIEISENALLLDENGHAHCYGTDAKVKNVVRKKPDVNLTMVKKETSESDPKTMKQLTSNQIVLLLQEIGFFSHPKIENAPKTKQSELISKICGLNDKNLKIKIQNLDKTPKELGDNHQKDIDKIDDILNNLE